MRGVCEMIYERFVCDLSEINRKFVWGFICDLSEIYMEISRRSVGDCSDSLTQRMDK